MTMHDYPNAEATRDAAREALQTCGLQATLNRILVLASLAASRNPLTAREIHERVLAEHALNRVTVYRILDLLADKGAVNRIPADEGAARYCARTGRWPQGHSHFHCTQCGEVRCIDNAALHFDAKAVGDTLPLDVHHVALRLDGVCAACKAKGQ